MSLAALEARGARIGEAAAQRAAETLAVRITAEMPGVRAEVVRQGVALSGRGLMRRLLADPALRAFGTWLR